MSIGKVILMVNVLLIRIKTKREKNQKLMKKQLTTGYIDLRGIKL